MYGFADAKTGRFPPNQRDNSLRAVGSLGSDSQSPGGRTAGLLDGSGLTTARNWFLEGLAGKPVFDRPEAGEKKGGRKAAFLLFRKPDFGIGKGTASWRSLG